MKKKNIFLTILLWLEVVICLRVLLFIVPFWISEYTSQQLTGMTLKKWYILVITITSIFYFLAGFIWLAGYKSGKLIHYIGFIVVMGLTGSFIVLSKQVTGSFESTCLIPLGLTTLMIVGISLIKEKADLK